MAELWIPSIEADVVWYAGPPTSAPDAEQALELVPVVSLEPAHVAAAVAESSHEAVTVLAVFGSCEALREAATMGLKADEVTVVHLAEDNGRERVGADFYLDKGQRECIRDLQRRGFTFNIQALPNVTARPWTQSSHETVLTE
ncbi:MAG: mannose/fructose/N-acetylgalactosamine-specific phosphotransferase system component IIB [Bradymonadia bacterium]|jgi:mannose/fructose/N-acetylgalactosamine-specific phosphotransferase system component IIB